MLVPASALVSPKAREKESSCAPSAAALPCIGFLIPKAFDFSAASWLSSLRGMNVSPGSWAVAIERRCNLVTVAFSAEVHSYLPHSLYSYLICNFPH